MPGLWHPRRVRFDTTRGEPNNAARYSWPRGNFLPPPRVSLPGGRNKAIQVTNRVSASGSTDLASRSQAAPADMEAAWLRAARAGDRDAFGRLVETHQQRLFHCLLRLCGSADDAQELAQDAFVQAYVKLDSFQENSAFFTWLYRIAFNLAASRARRRRPRTSLDAACEAGAAEPTAPAEPPDGPMIQHERDSLVQLAIGRLPHEQRQVIVLREIEGLDYGQIADVLQTPVGTVRSRLFRARMQLRELLAPMFAEETSN